MVEIEKEIQEWNKQKLPKVLPGYSGGRLPGRRTKEKGREEGELDEDSEKRKIRNEIAQEVVASRRRQARMITPRRLHEEQLGKSVKHDWDCSHIANAEEEEEDDWRKENQMGV